MDCHLFRSSFATDEAGGEKTPAKFSWNFSPPIFSAFKRARWLAASPRPQKKPPKNQKEKKKKPAGIGKRMQDLLR